MYTFNWDDEQVKRSFRRLAKKTPELQRRILQFIGEAVVNRTVSAELSGQTLKRKTGTLAKSIRHKMVSDNTVKVGTNVKYAAIHEFGGIIEPKMSAYLSFKVADNWVRTKKVTMPARPYLYPSIEWVMGNRATDIFNKQCSLWIENNFRGR